MARCTGRANPSSLWKRPKVNRHPTRENETITNSLFEVGFHYPRARTMRALSAPLCPELREIQFPERLTIGRIGVMFFRVTFSALREFGRNLLTARRKRGLVQKNE